VLRAADDLNVAAKGAVLIAMSFSGDRIARPLMRDEPFDGPVITCVQNGLVVAPRLAVGLTTDDHRIDDRAKLPPAFDAGSFDRRIVREQHTLSGIDLMAGADTRSEYVAA
jgi:hypothetical protein